VGLGHYRSRLRTAGRHRSLRRPGLPLRAQARRALGDQPRPHRVHLPSPPRPRLHDGKPFTARDVIATFDKIQDPKAKTMHLKAYTQELESYARSTTTPSTSSGSGPISSPWKRRSASASSPRTSSSNSAPPTTTRPRPIHQSRPDRHRDRSVLASGRATRRSSCAQRCYWARRRTSTGGLPHRQGPTVALELAERANSTWSTAYRRRNGSGCRSRAPQTSGVPAILTQLRLDRLEPASPTLQDARVRRALTLLVDRPGMISGLLHGLALPTTCHFYYKSKDCDPSSHPCPTIRRPPPAARGGGLARHQPGRSPGEGAEHFRFVFMVRRPARPPSAWRPR